jgi:hypothetical protein
MGDNYVGGFLDARYEPGNPSLTNLTAPSPSPPPTTNATTNTNVVVGAVVGGNFAQVAVIVLGILYHQGRVTFNFCGIFRKMGLSCWRKTEDELVQKMKDSGDVEAGEFNFLIKIQLIQAVLYYCTKLEVVV